MTAQRWGNQDTYADLIESIAAANGVPASLAYAVIAQESGFNPQATGPTQDYGLMQVTLSTAKALGYTGTPFGLFDPQTNLMLGLQLLGGLLASHGGDVGAALSAYNGGDRPALGYGARLADGTFRNQSYVNNVLANVDYFDTYLAERDGTGSSDGGIPTDPGTADGTGVASVAGFLALAAAGYALARSLQS